MTAPLRFLGGLLAVILLGAAADASAAAERAGVRVATFNVQNYLCMDRRIAGRFLPGHPKPEAEKAAVRAVIREVQPDILCLQEMGPQPFLDELQQDLAHEGLEYRYATLLQADDPLRHVAVLARIPWQAVVAHRDLTFDYLGRTETVKRGLLELQFDGPAGPWRLFVVHLKSPLTEDAADPLAEKRRTTEARMVRDRIVRGASALDTACHLIVGDLNASPDSRTLSALTRRGETVVAQVLPAADSRGETWTHRQLQSERYERLDYVLASPALVARIPGGRAFVHDGEAALQGSDHRMVWVDLDWSHTAEP